MNNIDNGIVSRYYPYTVTPSREEEMDEDIHRYNKWMIEEEAAK